MKPLADKNNLIYQLRKKLNLTQEQLGEELGCSYMTARRAEYGIQPKSKAVLRNLEKLLEENEIEGNPFVSELV